MRGISRGIVLNSSIICVLLCRSVWTIICHREQQFVKLQGAFPSVNPIKVTTTSTAAFCCTECTELQACKSFAFSTDNSASNCHLSASPDGMSTGSSASVVYKKDPGKGISGCASNPCQNGGTCEDLCEAPYFICRCPAHAQGKMCEYNINCATVDWGLPFDNEGTHVCPGSTNYMAGFKRGDCDDLNCIEEAICCPVTIEYSQPPDRTCSNGWWWDSFATDAWNNCPDGHFLTGFYRAGGSQALGWLEEGVCCRPVDAPAQWVDCYHEDIGLSFDAHWATARCHKPLHFIVAIRTSNCEQISCIEELKCCKMQV